MNNISKTAIKYISLFLIALLLTSCGSGQTTSFSSKEIVGRTQNYNSNTQMMGRPYLIQYVDTTLGEIMLQDMKNGRNLLYSYNLETHFMDKYDGLISVMSFVPGRICSIEGVDSKGLISDIKLSDQVWEFEDVTNYKIDRQKGVLSVGDVNYRIQEDTPVYSNGVNMGLDSITENDTLRLLGQDKDIWTITVTTGHGILSVVNTSVFNGSLLVIGNIYTMLNGDMNIEIPEGVYNITAANDGYGGSATIEMHRGEQITLDLDAIKTYEKQYCTLTFNIEVPNATITIDNNPVNKDEPFPIEYGKHSLTVKAPGYDSWTKYLFVNSPTATIMLTMEEEDKASNNNSSNNNNNNGGNNSNSQGTDKDKEGNSTTSSSSETEKRKTELDYITTIRDTANAIMNSLSM